MNILRVAAVTISFVFLALAPEKVVAQNEASGIFAGARALYLTAQTKPEGERLEDYRGIQRLLNLIVEDYPSSDLAVRILLQENIDGVDIAAISAALAAPKPAATEQPATVAPQIAGSTSSTSAAVGDDGSTVPSEETVVLVPQIEVPARTEKEIVLDVQNELNRIGCPVGTADGVAGRKTKAAFLNFINDSGVDLSEDDLATEEAISILKEQEGTVCEVRTMASTPASALGGSWGFRSDCPGFGNRIIRNTGSMNLTYRGNNTLKGPARNRQGNTGSAVIQFQGGRTAATIIQFGFVKLQGNLTRSTSSMTISGTGSNRCKIVAWKN